MTSQTSPTVGFIGLGDQGLPMASAIAEAGFPLHAWARRPTSLDGLAEVAHVRHDDITEFASACDIVSLCVNTDQDVLELVRGGLLDGLRPGSVVVNHGTGTPGNARLIAGTCAVSGVGFLDAPVSGGRLGAEARALTTMVGGPEEVAVRCEAMFRSFSAHVVYLGEHGSGQIAKLFNNALLMMNRASIAELVDLAARVEVDPIRLVEALKLGSGSSQALELLPVNSPVSLDEAAEHLAGVELLDMELFDTAISEFSIEAKKVTARGVRGANELRRLVQTLNPPPNQAD